MKGASPGRHRQRVLRLLRRAEHGAAPSRVLLLLGALAVLLMLLVLAQAVLRDRDRFLGERRQHQSLLARLFEDQVSRELDAAAFSLQALAQALPREGPPAADWNAAAAQALVYQRSLREIVLVDPQGLVLGGSRPFAPDTRVPLERLQPEPKSDRPQLGLWTAGRFLAESGAVKPPAGLGFVPLLLRVRGPERPLWLVATLHSEGWSVAMRAALGQGPERAAVLHFDGQLLAHSGSVTPGANWSERLKFLADSGRPFGTLEGVGTEATPSLIAWRQVANRPLVVLVEQARDEALTLWWKEVWLYALGSAMFPTVLALGVVVGWLRLRQREVEQGRIAASQRVLARHAGELSNVMSALRELLFRTDAAGRLVFLNARARELFGCDPETLQGRLFAELVDRTDQGEASALFSGQRGSAHSVARVSLLLAGGERRRFEVTVVPLVDMGGQLGFAGCAVEITRHEHERERLVAAASFNARLVELNPLPTSLLDDEGRYLQVNAAWEAFFGVHRDRIIGTLAARLQRPEDAARHEAMDQELRQRGGSLSYEARFVRPDGEGRELLISKARLPEHTGSLPAILCMVVDVTALRRSERSAEARLDQARRATAVAQDLFQAFEAPLERMRALLHGAPASVTDPQELTGLSQQLGRLSAELNDRLELARHEAGLGPQVEVDVTQPELGALLQQAFAAQAGLDPASAAVRLQWHLPRQAPVQPVSIALLQRLLGRLLGLAAHATLPNGTLVVDVRGTPQAGWMVSLSCAAEGARQVPATDDSAWQLCAQMADALHAPLRLEPLARGAWRLELALAGSEGA